jgi:hypothetical protein
MKSILKGSLCAALLAGAAVAVQAADVHTDYDKHADFSRIHNYCWGHVSTANPMFEQRIKDEVDKDLQGRGWQQSSGGACDAEVFAKGDVHNQTELQTYYTGLGGGWGGGWGWGGWGWRSGWWGPGPETTTTEINKPVGSLVIDIFDGQSKSLIFRGIATGDVSKNPDKNTHNLDKDIDKMFDHFPPKK